MSWKACELRIDETKPTARHKHPDGKGLLPILGGLAPPIEPNSADTPGPSVSARRGERIPSTREASRPGRDTARDKTGMVQHRVTVPAYKPEAEVLVLRCFSGPDPMGRGDGR